MDMPLREPMRHDNVIWATAYSPDGATVVTGSWDHTARLWDAHNAKPIGQPMKHNANVMAVAYSPNGTTVLTGSLDGTARLWDARTGRPIGEPMQDGDRVEAVAFSPDGATALTKSYSSALRWDVPSGKPIGEPIRDDTILAAAFSPDSKTVLTGNGAFSISNVLSGPGIARLWDAGTGKAIGVPMKHTDPVYAVAYSPDGRTVVTGSGVSNDQTHRGEARLWDARTGRPIGQAMKHDVIVNFVAYSPDGATVLTASDDATARLWDARTGQPIGEAMHHDNAIKAIAFSPDGASILIGSMDRTARLWDARTGKPIREPMKHDNSVDAVAYSPDGTTVLTASGTFTGLSGTGVALLWDAPHRIPDQLVGLVASTRLRARLNDEGLVEDISDEEYSTAWKKLETEGAEWLAERQRHNPRRIIGWHHYQAAEAETRRDWFAADFHLRWLLKSEPDDAELPKRHEHAKQYLAASRAAQQLPSPAPTDPK